MSVIYIPQIHDRMAIAIEYCTAAADMSNAFVTAPMAGIKCVVDTM